MARPCRGSSTTPSTPEQRWAITDFIVSLSGTNGPGYTNLVIAKHVPEQIDLAKGAASFASAPVARFPIVGQIMEPGRAFHPPTTGVTVQAIYDADSIAMLVRWHDMSAQKTGKNGPSLPVPPEEEEAPAIGAGEGCERRREGEHSAGPLCRGGSARRPAIRVLRRGRRPDSFADADRTPASPTSSSAIPRTPWISGSSIWQAPIPFSSPARVARISRPRTRGISPESRATTRENGRSSSSGLFARHRPPHSRPERSCRSGSRSGTVTRASVATGEVSRSGTHSTSSQKPSHRPSARW